MGVLSPEKYGKKIIPLEYLNYWNVDKQEAYFSYVESSINREKEDN